MDRELGIPRECFEWFCDYQKFSKFNINENLDCYKNDNWVVISGFPRHLISLIRPQLESEIGPIDNWINGYAKGGLDMYFVYFRSPRILQKSLQFNNTSISGYNINICPCFENIYSGVSSMNREVIFKEEFYNNSDIKVRIL